MTTLQLIQEIEAAGGVLALKGDKIAYNVPAAARSLVDVLRRRRDEVLRTLSERQAAAKQQMSRWMVARCTRPTNRRRAWGSEKSLFRDYLGWCQETGHAPCSGELFFAILTESFRREPDGWQGLCLTVDLAASRLATERTQ
jgi:hypothetical protein